MLKPLDKPPLTIRLCQPRGFCAGVDRAIQIVVLALKKYGAPVYVRHEIVHNRYVVEGLQKLGAVFIEELDEIPAEHRAVPGGVFRAWRAEIGAGRCAGAQSVLPRRDLPAGLQGPQAGDAPPAARPPCAADRPFRPSRSDRHDGPAAGRRGDADRDRGRRRHLRAGRSVGPRLRHPDHAVGRRHGRHHPRARGALSRARRRRPPNRSAMPPPTARKRSRKRRRAPISSWSSARPIRRIRAGWSRLPSAPAPRCRFSCSAPPKSRGRRSARLPALGLSAGASAPEIIVDEIIDAFRERYDVTVELAVTATETEDFPVMRVLRDVELTRRRHGLRQRSALRPAWRSTPTSPRASSARSCGNMRSASSCPTRASPRARELQLPAAHVERRLHPDALREARRQRATCRSSSA